MNAANEVAVARFRRGEIRFTDIWAVIEKTMAAHTVMEYVMLDEVLAADSQARAFALECKI
jgi:1-deoxy-D-xylulose-5-phosphate reductoisomerase